MKSRKTYNLRNRIVIAVLTCCILYSCSQTLYVPTSPDAARQEQLLKGRDLYVQHCSGCHNLHLPNEYTAVEWQKKLDEMQEKAKITTEEKQSIFQ